MRSKVLKHNVLVLNKSWVPIHITTVKDAIGIVYVGAAQVIVPNNMRDRHDRMAAYEFEALNYDKWTEISARLDNDSNEFIRSPKDSHFKPNVVALTKYNGIPKYTIKFCRSSIYERDKGICQYCEKKINKFDATLDHIIPKSRGGRNNWNNIVFCCKKCNDKKRNKTPAEANMSLLNEPKRPSWIAVKFGKARTIKERAEWLKFTSSVEEEIMI